MRRRSRSWLRLVAFVLLAAVLRPAHTAADDDACSWLGGALQSDGRAAVVAGDAEPAPPEHCAVCHWVRSLRSPLTSVHAVPEPAAPPSALAFPVLPGYTAALAWQLPPRAPPVLP